MGISRSEVLSNTQDDPGAGPREIVRWTVEPTTAVEPPTGFWLITRPAAIVLL
jgi:hypothetical protein